MAQIIGTLLVVALAIVAIKLALVAIVLAGLIFRPKETLGVVLLLGAFAVLRTYPMASFGIVALMIIYAIIKALKSETPADTVTKAEEDQS
ncbi:hypothetical protein [Sphingomonas melonis]